MKKHEIPIEDYEKDFETELGKEKKREILDLFKSYNNLNLPIDWIEVDNLLHIACRQGDVELIKICLSESIEDFNGMVFKINKTEKTASLFKVNNEEEHLIIPRTIRYELNDYLVTSIIGIASQSTNFSKIKTIKFDENSAVRTFYSISFKYSNIEEIYFPASLNELKEGWCCDVKKLKKIIVSPLNNQFIFKDDKYLLGKSDKNSDEFDIILFASRDINQISIPPNIKVISSYAFESCEKLIKVEISNNSNLQTIKNHAFFSSGIEEISLPSKVTKICEYAFAVCRNLTNFVIPTNSNLELIENNAFTASSIEEIFIPSKVTKISKYAFSSCRNLTNIGIPTNSNLKSIEKDAFSYSGIEKIFIPSQVAKICDSAFSFCYYLSNIEFSKNSNLQIIEKYAFYSTNIDEILIPSSVIKICQRAFSKCYNLIRVEIPTNSKLQSIEKYAFSSSKIEELYFPTSLNELMEGWCSETKKLRKIIISPLNDKLIFIDDKYLLGKSCENKDEFDILLFASRNIKDISIPSKVTKICESAFEHCIKITRVEIPKNSNLQIIGKNAFSYSSIKYIYIPSKVIQIGEHAFCECLNFLIIEISEESKLQSLSKLAFDKCKNLIIMIPL